MATAEEQPTGYPIPKEYHPTYAPQTYGETYPKDEGVKAYSIRDFWYFIGDIAKVLLSVAGMIAVFYIVQAGFFYVTSGGAQEKLDAAKNTLKWAFLGLMAVLFSYALVDFILTVVTSINGN